LISLIESAGAEEVLTLQETAELLRLPVETVRASAFAGELPGRVFGDEWRFARAAVLAWLAGGDAARHEVGPRSGSELD
jgi:excisionase family DNA binding protein